MGLLNYSVCLSSPLRLVKIWLSTAEYFKQHWRKRVSPLRPSSFRAAGLMLLMVHSACVMVVSRRLKWIFLAVTNMMSCCHPRRAMSSFGGCWRLGLCLIPIWFIGKVMELCTLFSLPATRWHQRLTVFLLIKQRNTELYIKQYMQPKLNTWNSSILIMYIKNFIFSSWE